MKSILKRHSISAVLVQIQDSIDLDDRSFSDLLEITPSAFAKIKAGNTTCPLKNLYALCDKLELSVGQVLKGNIDLAALDQQFHGNAATFPDKYQNPRHQLGKARALLGLFDYLDTYYGKEVSRSIRQQLQIRAQAFSDPMLPVSPMILIDALQRTQEIGLSDIEIKFSGTHNLLINRDTLLGKLLAAKSSAKELYRSIHEELRGYYDQLFDYQLVKLHSESCSIRVQLKESIQDVFSTFTLGNRQVCLYKQGVYASFLGNIQGPLARIQESQCMYKGDESCVYHLSW